MCSRFIVARRFQLGFVLCTAALNSCSSNQPTGVGPPSLLAFTVQPNTTTAGSPIAPAVQVAVEDAQGNIVTNATPTITLAIGTNPAGGTLSGMTSVGAANGVASFSALVLNRTASGYTL